MVYIINKDGKPLMPTKRHGKVKHLLRSGKAKVVQRTPFTIQLLYQATSYVQDVTLGVDAGSKTVGLSASTQSEELYASETALRTDIVKLLSTKREHRRTRRNRKTRYRAPRFNNRVSSKQPGWLAPSIKHKIDTHLKLVENIHKILPISKIVVEVAAFDIQKIKNPDITGTQYQQGEQLGTWNVREYVLFRDGHTCRHCKGKSKDKVLCTHHIESRKTGGDAPNNLITLCETCHKLHHLGNITVTVKRKESFKAETFMGIMRWAFYNKLKDLYNNTSLTYGYITKNTRIEHGLPKTHALDALCIAGHPTAKRLDFYFAQRAVRRNNRSLHKATILKGGIRKKNKAPYEIFGFRLFDPVSYQGVSCFVFGRRASGSFDIRKLDGTPVHRGISYKKLALKNRASSLLTERRAQGAEVY